MNLSGTSVMTVAGSLSLARNTSTSTGAVQLASSALLLVNGSAGWLSVGSGGVGSFTMMNNSMMTNSRDENIADTTGSTGTLNIQDNATNLTANLYVGKSGTAGGVVNRSEERRAGEE